MDGLAYSIWLYIIFPQLIYIIYDNYIILGWLSFVNGVSEVIAAIIAGYLVDVLSRQLVARMAGCIGMIAVILGIVAVYTEKLGFFYASSSLFGAYTGTNSSSMESLFADSVISGQRSRIYTIKYIFEVSSGIGGSALAILLFLTIGNTWSMTVIKIVMYVGYGMHLTAMILLFSVNEKDSLGKESDKVFLYRSVPTEEQRCTMNVKYLPYIIVISEFIVSLGSGMTVNFFPLYLTQLLNVTPITICIVTSLGLAISAICAKLLIPLSSRIGRIRTLLLVRVTGPLFLIYLSLMHTDFWSIITAYTLRAGIMNATTGMSRAILMDHVEKSSRGKWNAMESVSSFSSAASASMGGYLIGSYGYYITFLITTVIHYVSAGVLSSAFRTKEENVVQIYRSTDDPDEFLLRT